MGKDGEGTQFAVSELLEILGVRWYWPGKLGEVVPRLMTVAVDPLDIAQSPDFAWRDRGPGGALRGATSGPTDMPAKTLLLGITPEHRAEVTGVAFGGYDLDVRHVTEAQGGALYKLRAAHRSQRLPWEPGQPLHITEPSDGAIVNRHDGEISPDGLRITVKGAGGRGDPVKVNGATVPVRGGAFQAAVVEGA